MNDDKDDCEEVDGEEDAEANLIEWCGVAQLEIRVLGEEDVNDQLSGHQDTGGPQPMDKFVLKDNMTISL